MLNKAFRAATTSNGRPYTYKTTAAKRWQKDAHWLIISQRGNTPTLTGDVKVHMELHLKYNRDADSSFKLVLDTLEKAGVIENDRQITQLSVEKFIDKRDILILYVEDLEATRTA